MKKLLLVVMMLCLAHSAFAWTWKAVVEAKKDDGSWKYTAKEIFDIAIEQKRGFNYPIWDIAAEIGRSDIIKVLQSVKPGTNQTYGEIINMYTEHYSKELGRDDRFLFDVSFRYPMRTELQTALYYGQKETAKDFIRLGANPFKNGRVEYKLHGEDPGMSTREFAVLGGLGDFFDNVILKMPEVTNNLAKLKREAEIYNEKFKNTPRFAYADPAEMKMQRNKTVKEMLLAVCDALRSKFPPQVGALKRASQAA